MENLKSILATHAFFEGMTEPYLDLMAGCAKNVRFEVGEEIFHEGEDAAWFYLIRHGSVALEVEALGRKPLTLLTLAEGDVLGVSWLFPPHRWVFGARARTLVRAIALDAHCLRNKCEEDHNLGFELMRRFSQMLIGRLQAGRMQLLDMYNIPHAD